MLLEAVPNFSEGRDLAKIQAIATAIEAVPGVRLLGVDAGASVNRTVMSLVGPPDAVLEASFLAIAQAAELIDMRKQRGTHPRIGGTDVCPLVPLRGLGLSDAALLAERLAERVGRELRIPVYLYASCAKQPWCRELAQIRRGEYEGLREKMMDPAWRPDFGPCTFQPESGATVIGARPLMLAYNVNLAGRDAAIAGEIAAAIRERGPRVAGLRRKGAFPGLKAIGWYIGEFDRAQVSMNLMHPFAVPLEKLYERISALAELAGERVDGSELVGLAPRAVLVRAGEALWREANPGVVELPGRESLIRLAAEGLGLGSVKEFDPRKQVLEEALGVEDDFLG